MKDDSTLVVTSDYPRLTVKVGEQVVQQVSLKDELRIGRAPDNDVKLTDQMVSRHHAFVQRREGTFILTDLGSANGTYVRGVRLTEPYTLSQGDVFSVGKTEMLFEARDAAYADTLTAPVLVPGTTPGASPSTQTQRLTPKLGKENRGLVLAIAALAAIVLLVLAGVLLFTFAPDFVEQIGLKNPSTPEAEAETASPTPDEPAAAGTVVEAAVTPEASPTALSSVAPEEFNELLAQADALTWRSKFEDAIAIYDHLSGQSPEDARPEVGWARALILDDEAPEALAHAERSVQLDPASPDAVAVLARAYVDTGNKAEALARAEEAVKLDSGSADAHAVLAEAYLLNDEEYKAVDAADLALVKDINNANAHRIRAWLYDRVDGDMGRAAGEFQTAAGLQPELWLRRHELGLLLLDAENYSTAIIAFQDALGLRPKAVTYSAIGEAYYLLGQYDQAKASLLQALSAGAEDLQTHALMGATYAQLNRCDEAQTYVDLALAMDSSNELALEAQEICEEGGGSAPPAGTAPSAGSTSEAESSAVPAATKKAPPSLPVVGGRIVFPVWNAESGRYDSYIAQAKNGSGRAVIASEMHQPAISPDGLWVAMNGERHEGQNLFIVGSNGSDMREITEHIEDGLPVWSADSKDLAFSSTRHGDKQSRVYIIDDVFLKGAKTRSRALNFGPDDVRGEYPSWTEDGQIVYKGCDSTVTPAECGLFIIPSLGGPQPATRLLDDANATAPAASAGKIAFMSDRDGNWEIYVMNDDGSGLARLTNNASLDGLPTWSPDGKALAFVSNQGGPWAVWVMSPDGSNRSKLFEIGDGGLAYEWQNERVSWGP